MAAKTDLVVAPDPATFEVIDGLNGRVCRYDKIAEVHRGPGGIGIIGHPGHADKLDGWFGSLSIERVPAGGTDPPEVSSTVGKGVVALCRTRSGLVKIELTAGGGRDVLKKLDRKSGRHVRK